MKLWPSIPQFACGVFVLALPASLTAQEMHHPPSTSVPSNTLTIRGLGGKSLVLSAADLTALPHRTVTVINGHSHANETYSGVPLSALPAKVGVPQGDALKGPLFLVGVVAQGTDGYQVLYSLAEVDPAAHTGEVLVADAMDGEPLGEAGSFKLVSSEDKRPARWVRNLKAIIAAQVKP